MFCESHFIFKRHIEKKGKDLKCNLVISTGIEFLLREESHYLPLWLATNDQCIHFTSLSLYYVLEDKIVPTLTLFPKALETWFDSTKYLSFDWLIIASMELSVCVC